MLYAVVVTCQSDTNVQTQRTDEGMASFDKWMGDLIGRPISISIFDNSVGAIGFRRDLTDRAESRVSMLSEGSCGLVS